MSECYELNVFADYIARALSECMSGNITQDDLHKRNASAHLLKVRSISHVAEFQDVHVRAEKEATDLIDKMLPSRSLAIANN